MVAHSQSWLSPPLTWTVNRESKALTQNPEHSRRNGGIVSADGTLAASAEGKYMRRALKKFTDASFSDDDWFRPDYFPSIIRI